MTYLAEGIRINAPALHLEGVVNPRCGNGIDDLHALSATNRIFGKGEIQLKRVAKVSGGGLQVLHRRGLRLNRVKSRLSRYKCLDGRCYTLPGDIYRGRTTEFIIEIAIQVGGGKKYIGIAVKHGNTRQQESVSVLAHAQEGV